jgi:hydroxymethylpyrimidine kinase/phosphomethylpyrimidine kinase/thiamine-phosphate diphosphorylase
VNTVCVFSETQADLHTLEGLGLLPVQKDSEPHAIKIGSCNLGEELEAIRVLLKGYTGCVVLDSPDRRMSGILPQIDILVLNRVEAELFLNFAINSLAEMEQAVVKLVNLGAKSVLLKGEHPYDPLWLCDYWSNGNNSFWLSQPYYSQTKYPELKNVFSTALTAFLAENYSPEDAVVLAKMYTHQAVRLGKGSLYFGGFPEEQADLPYLSSAPLNQVPKPFKPVPYLGLYPIVDSAQWVETLLGFGVKTIQLRIKEQTEVFEEEIKRSIALAKQHQAILFINDYWELALKFGAEAVHLGQSDLATADLDAIRQKGLFLGVSTHCYYEVARAHAINPSYLAIGPIYPTTSKEMVFNAQGIIQLQRWKRTLNYPLVAIGGINLERVPEVIAAGVSGVALISAITQSQDPQESTRQFLRSGLC